jgi:hypothetical protein
MDQMAGAEKKWQAQIFFNFHIWRISFLGFWFSNFEAPIRLRSAQILVSHPDAREFYKTTPGVVIYSPFYFFQKKNVQTKGGRYRHHLKKEQK